MPEASEQVSALQRIAAAPAVQSRWNTEIVRSAWSAVQRRRRDAERAARRSVGDLGGELAVAPEGAKDPLTWGWIEQLWTDHVIVRCGDNSDQAARIPFTVEAPGTAPEHVRFGQPERVRMAYVAASRAGLDAVTSSSIRASNAVDVVALAGQRRVRSMQGARRYRKPIGSPLGDGAGGRPTAGRDAGSRPAESGKKDVKDLADRAKKRHGGKVFGGISNEGKLKSALSSINNLPDGKRGAAAAEIVLAAQSLGLTRLVPASVKRLYRAYLAQKPLSKPVAKKE